MNKLSQTKHVPVMMQEVLELIELKTSGVIVDATLGGGGHLNQILQTHQDMKVLAFDQDVDAIQRYRRAYLQEVNEQRINETISKYRVDNNLLFLINENFAKLNSVTKDLGIKKIDRVLADLGTSQDQLEDQERGFSYKRNAELDMRMDQRLNVRAADLLNGLTYKQLVKLFSELADLGRISKVLSGLIVDERKKNKIVSTKQLNNLIYRAVSFPKGSRTSQKERVSSLEARVFQALRIAVNQELYSLKQFLPQAFGALNFEGRLIVVTFHSGEDRIVKNFFREKEKRKEAESLVRLLTPQDSEIQVNPRSSSAKVRAIKKIK